MSAIYEQSQYIGDEFFLLNIMRTEEVYCVLDGVFKVETIANDLMDLPRS
jgi:hypothetical protein